MNSLTPDRQVTEEECVRIIRDTLVEETEPVRKEYFVYGKTQHYTRMKAKLPRAFFTAEMSNLCGRQTHVSKSDLFAVDIDLDHNEKLFDMYSIEELEGFILENFSCVSIIHVSASGRGLRVVHRITPVLSPATEWLETDAYDAMSYLTRSAWLFYADYYAKMSIAIDPSCADAYRCGFLAHDPNVIYVPDASPCRIIVQPFADIKEMKILTKSDRVRIKSIKVETFVKPAAEVKKFVGYALSRAKFIHEMDVTDQTGIYAYIISFGRNEGYDVQQMRDYLTEYGYDVNAQFALAIKRTEDSGYTWTTGYRHEYLVHLISQCCVMGITEDEFREMGENYVIDRVASNNTTKIFKSFNN